MALPEGAPADFASCAAADSVVFDCDGVLVDVSGSYDRTIAHTAAHLLGTLGVPDAPQVDAELIEAFKASGGFNDEVDLTYAAVLAISAAHRAHTDARELIRDMCARIGSRGISAVEEHLAQVADVSDVVSRLDYPHGASSPVRETFNKLFYGRKLYSSLCGSESDMEDARYIDNDVLLVDERIMRSLAGTFGRRPAVVTGRGRAPFEHSVPEAVRGLIDMRSSVFLEDEPRSHAKPDPRSLLRAISSMGSERTLYVGDSMEDLIMARRATEAGSATAFCGICGTARDPAGRAQMFAAAGADAVAMSVAELAKILNQSAR